MLHPTAPPARRSAHSRFGVGMAALVTAAVLLLAGCGTSSDESADATVPATALAPSTGAGTGTATSAPAGSGGPAVVKDVLGTEVDPPGAEGRTLSLVRYTIPPGAQLAPHVHPGVQMARITSGVLTYTVVEGTAIVRRSGTTVDEELTAPATTRLLAGDTVTELDGMVHFGANDTDEDVVIDATLLTRDGEDLAVPVTTP